MTPKQRQTKVDIAESREFCITIISYYKHVQVDYERARRIAEQRAEAAGNELADIIAKYDAAPQKIIDAERKLAALGKQEHTVLIQPKLAQLIKLRAEIARLEAE